MLAGACKQKPPSFLILLFVPKSGFLKDWLSHQPLPGSRFVFVRPCLIQSPQTKYHFGSIYIH